MISKYESNIIFAGFLNYIACHTKIRYGTVAEVDHKWPLEVNDLLVKKIVIEALNEI